MRKLFTKTIILVVLITLAAGCGPAAPTAAPVSPTASPVPATPMPPTATPIPLALAPTALPGALTVAAPPGDPPTLDGTLSPGEWDSARREKFSDGSELLLMQNGGYLYLGIRANSKPPEGLQGNQCATMWSVYLDRGDEIAVLHSSAALGTAVYKRAESGWQRARAFAWTLRNTSFGDAIRRQQFPEQEGWLASLCAMGKLEEAEFQLAMPQGSLRLAVAFPLPPTYDEAAVWPVGLDDDVRNMDLLEGDAPAQARFSPERWAVVMVAGYETAGPAPTEEPVPATNSPVSPTAVPVSPTSAAVLPTRMNASALAVISVDTAGQVELVRTLSGHQDRVMALAFSGDGAHIASASRDKTIKLWDIRSGQEVYAFSVNEVEINSIAFSPDGSVLASAEAIWDVESRQVLHTLEGSRQFPGHVAFSPDGALLAVGGHRPVKLWDVASGQAVRTFDELANNDSFTTVFSPDGTLIATSGYDGVITLWDVPSGQVARTLSYDREVGIHSAVFSPDGRLLASGGTDPTIRLWDIASGQIVRTLSLGDGLYGLAFSPDGSLLASAGCDRTVKLWDVASGRILRSLPHPDEVMAVAFSPDGTLLVSGGYDKQVYLWGVSH